MQPTVTRYNDTPAPVFGGPNARLGPGDGQLSDINKIISGLTTAALRASSPSLANAAVVGALGPMPHT